VIDDDASVRTALGRLIRSAGYEVSIFESAESFLQSGLPKPDCLVLDARMPDMSGLQLQQYLIAHCQQVRTVFVSAHDDPATRSAALTAGAIAFLAKPVEDTVILGAIKQAIGAGEGNQ
jgi:FixJ family two-component response regulator